MKQQDVDDLKQLIDFLKEYQISEFDLERDDLKIRLKFNQQAAAQSSLGELARLLNTVPQSAAPAPVAVAPQTASAAPQDAQPDSEAGLHVVKSPIVGTYYGSPSPGAAPFVVPGDRVEKGQVICIVEAMKLMNEIESDVSGEIVKCLVSNGQPIEFGQPLFSVRQG